MTASLRVLQAAIKIDDSFICSSALHSTAMTDCTYGEEGVLGLLVAAVAGRAVAGSCKITI